MATQLPGGTVHALPEDLALGLVVSATALIAWRTITPLVSDGSDEPAKS